MDNDKSKLLNAWIKASKDLNIEIVYPIRIDNNEKFILFINNFGCAKGTLIGDMDDFDELYPIASKNGYYFSGLNPAVYSVYSRDEFIDTLIDWGWHGNNSNKPKWLLKIKI